MRCKECERSVPIWAKADENMCAEHSYERLNEEVKRLKEALERYGQHLPNCMTLCVEDLSGMCDCGFVENKVRCSKC